MLLLALVLTAAPVVQDPRGFHFTVPEGFEAFPNFRPTSTKLYAFGKDLGTPDAIALTIDALEGPAGVGSPSCNALMHSIERTIGTPHFEKWGGSELGGLRMLMTHIWGEVLVLCVDVPLTPNGVSVKVSGKPDKEAGLHQTFSAVVASMSTEPAGTGGRLPLALGAIALSLVAAALLSRRLRNQAAPRKP